MILNEALVEKYKTQKRLAESSKDMHDYFERAKSASKELSEKYGFNLNYDKLHNKKIHQTQTARD